MDHSREYDDEELELSRLLNKKRRVVNEKADLQGVHEAIIKEQANLDKNGPVAAELSFDKWRLIHKYIHTRPFRLSSGQKRSDEWRDVAALFAPLNDPELDDWIALQIEVAGNREIGRSDLRVRRDGPCYLIVLEYVGNRKRTALAVLHWAKEDAEPRER